MHGWLGRARCRLRMKTMGAPSYVRTLLRLPLACLQEVVALIDECIALDPQQRPTAVAARRRLQAACG